MKLQNAYKNQDIDEIEKLSQEFSITSSSPSIDSLMVANRNINMANYISDYIQKGETLFAGIGALHLPDYKNTRGY